MDQALRLRESAGVAGGAIVELHGVNHAVSVEEVVAGKRLEERIGAVPDIDAVNGVGDFADDREVVLDGVLGHRREVSGDLDSWISRFRERVVELVSSEGGLNGIEGHCSCFLDDVPLRVGGGSRFWRSGGRRMVICGGGGLLREMECGSVDGAFDGVAVVVLWWQLIWEG